MDAAVPHEQQPGSERRDPRPQRRQRPAPVGPLPGQHHAEEAGGEVGGEGERVERHPVELTRGDGHGGPDGGGLERDQQNDGDDADAEGAITPPEHAFTGPDVGSDTGSHTGSALSSEFGGGVGGDGAGDIGVTGRFQGGHEAQSKGHDTT